MKFSRWIRSKTGTFTIIGVVSVLVIVFVVGLFTGWWEDILTSGTAGGGEWPDFTLPITPCTPPPAGGYTYLPTGVENDGKFLGTVGDDMRSFGGSDLVVWISVCGSNADFELGWFDGDSGRTADNSAINWPRGHWDNSNNDLTYTLYADPLANGEGMEMVEQWTANTSGFLDNAWVDFTVANVDTARGPSGHYFYRLVTTRESGGSGLSGFKLRTSGHFITGQSDLTNTALGIVGQLTTMNDVYTLYPNFVNWDTLGESTYDGEWTFYLYVPYEEGMLEFWDGDFDHGATLQDPAVDTDDPNTEGVPDWLPRMPGVDLNQVQAEGGPGRGYPPDDYNTALFRRSPAVEYNLIDPNGTPIHINDNPSGSEEWERFRIATQSYVDEFPDEPAPDTVVNAIGPGFYGWHVRGLDLSNIVWIYTDYKICDPEDGCGEQEWPEGACPRTIGYWKNNVKKVLVQGRPRGVQESPESLDWALRNIALQSHLFCAGIDVSNPQYIADCTRLTDAEADAILQKDAGNTMLDRALQQNLASWLNLGRGYLGPTTQLHLQDPSSGATLFRGAALDALLQAEDAILNGGDLEWAKTVADEINNGNLGEDAESYETCEAQPPNPYIPPEDQPPPYEEMPPAPTPVPPSPPSPVEPTCDNPVTNASYNVENPTANPFEGIKFEFQSGNEIKNGHYDNYEIVLSAADAAALTSVPVEAKAGTTQGITELTGCDFTSLAPCDQTAEAEGFAFYFMGATDNGDGTLTLTFRVQNFNPYAVSHVTIGVVPQAPTGSYDSQICPP